MTTIQHRLRHGYPSKERIEAADRIDALEAEVAALTKDAESPSEEPVGDGYCALMGCARTYAYEYSRGDDRLITAAYVRLQNAVVAAMKESK